MFSSIRSFFRSLIHRRRFESDMDEEMKTHLESRVEDLISRGFSPAQARQKAHLEFGSIEHYKEETRSSRGLYWIDRIRTDLRITIRSFRKSPTFTLTAIGTLAIGIAANTLTFSIIDSVLLRSLPYRNADRLYAVQTRIEKFSHKYPEIPLNAVHFAEWKAKCSSCENLALFEPSSFNLGEIGNPQRVSALKATADLLPMLGAPLQMGRYFSEAEDQPGSDHVIVISHDLWERSFGHDPNILGRKITLNQKSFEIIGVLSAQFYFPVGQQLNGLLRLPASIDMFLPLGLNFSKQDTTGNFNYLGFLRLKSPAQIKEAEEEMNLLLKEYSHKMNDNLSVILQPLKDRITGDIQQSLWMLSAASSALLLIVCVNLGNLLMARSIGKQRDWAIRSAIGASRKDLFRQNLIECMTLSFTGGGAGIFLTYFGLQLLKQVPVDLLPRLHEIQLHSSTLFTTLVLCVFSGFLCCLAPVFRIRKTEALRAMSAGSQRTGTSRKENQARNILVSFETGLTMLLASTAGLLIVSMIHVLTTEKGFSVNQILTFQAHLPEGFYSFEQRNLFHKELLERLQNLPGVLSAGQTTHLPLQGESWINRLRQKNQKESNYQANYRFVSPEYFKTAGINILAGGHFPEHSSKQIAILSKSAARLAFPNENPVGQEIHSDYDEKFLYEIVGIADDVKTAGLEAEPAPIVYFPFTQYAPSTASYLIRTSVDELTLTSAVRDLVYRLNPDVTVHQIRTMDEIVSQTIAPRRLQTLLAVSFAGVGIFLACLGVFGVVSHGVTRRTNEIGVRMALGATKSNVVQMILREVMTPVLTGLTGGLVVTLLLGKILSSHLFGVSPTDPLILATVFIVVLTTAFLAAYWPARRAARIEPMQALRWE